MVHHSMDVIKKTKKGSCFIMHMFTIKISWKAKANGEIGTVEWKYHKSFLVLLRVMLYH